jgi:hypothetical protein
MSRGQIVRGTLLTGKQEHGHAVRQSTRFFIKPFREIIQLFIQRARLSVVHFQSKMNIDGITGMCFFE